MGSDQQDPLELQAWKAAGEVMYYLEKGVGPSLNGAWAVRRETDGQRIQFEWYGTIRGETVCFWFMVPLDQMAETQLLDAQAIRLAAQCRQRVDRLAAVRNRLEQKRA